MPATPTAGYVISNDQQTIGFVANTQVPSLELQKIGHYRELNFTLSGTYQNSSNTYTSANVLGGDEWNLIQRLEVVANGVTIHAFSGEELRERQMFWFNELPDLSPFAVASQGSFISTCTLPFWDPHGENPLDTLLFAGGLSTLRVNVTWGSGDAIINKTGNATTASLLINTRRVEGLSLIPQTAFRTSRLQLLGASLSQTNDQSFFLPLGNTYKMILLNTKDTTNNDLPNCIDHIRLSAGGYNFLDTDVQTLRRWWKHTRGVPIYGLDSTRASIPIGFSSKADPGAWIPIPFVDDGMLSEALATGGYGELKLNVKTNQSIGQINLFADLIAKAL